MKTVEVRHPLVQHKIGLLRNAGLNTKDFRELVTELGTLLAYEATADLELTSETMAGWAAGDAGSLHQSAVTHKAESRRGPASCVDREAVADQNAQRMTSW